MTGSQRHSAPVPLAEFPTVAVVIPCLNEAEHIALCLDSLVSSDFPKDRLLVRVCDGMSEDGTRAIVADYAQRYPYIILCDNPERTTPHALNIGLRMGGFDVGIILGAHATVALDMIQRNIDVLRSDPAIGCSGGVIENVYDNATARRIGAAMGHPFGVGSAHFRTGRKAGRVDTVAFGAYRKEVFEQVGYFDAQLVRNQDDEFNFRVVKAGFHIVLDPAIRSYYFVRASYGKLFRQYDQYGYWKVYVNRKHGEITTMRQLVPALWVLFLLSGPLCFALPALFLCWTAIVALYVGIALVSSVRVSSSGNDVPGVMLAFFALHFAYGLGYVKGIWHLLLLRKHPGKRSRSLTRGPTANKEQDGGERSLFAAHGPVAGSLLVLLAVSLTLVQAALPVLLAASALALLLRHLPRSGPRASVGPSSTLFWGFLLYGVYLIGNAWSTNMDYAWFDLGIKAGIGLVPLLLLAIPDRSRVGGRTLLSAFVGGNILALIACFAVAFWRSGVSLLSGDGILATDWISSRFSLFMHPSYFAVHLCFALMVVLLRRPRGDDRGYLAFIPILLVAGIVLVGSKAGWAVLIACYVLLIVVRWSTPLRANLLGAGVLVAVLFAASVMVSPFMGEKVAQFGRIGQQELPAVDAQGSTEMRQLVWHAAKELLAENWLLGTGTGDVKDELLARYAEKGYVHPLEQRLNAHSQLLQTPLTIGLAGAVLMALLLLVPAVMALRARDALMVSFLLVLVLNWSVESMLEVQAGVMFLVVIGLFLALRGSVSEDGRTRFVMLTQYFPPETGAPQNRLHATATALVAQGVEVTIITGMPNYPDMVVREEYQGSWYRNERMDGMDVHRAWIFASPGKGMATRLGNYFSFVLSSWWVGMACLRRSDVLLVESPPLFLGATAMWLARAKGAKLVFNVSDLWPESAIQLGLVKSGWMITASTWLEELCYRRSDLITGQTKGIVENIQHRFPKKNVIWVPNGADLPAIEAVPLANDARERLSIPKESFVGLYAGIMGHAQGLETVVAAAEMLRNERDILFLLVGEGPVKADLQAEVEAKGLTNIRFLDRMPRSEVLALLKASDAVVVPLRRNDLFKGAIPSKIFEALALGKPLLLGVDGEARELFIRAGECGLFVPPEDAEALARAVLTYRNDPDLRKQHGVNASTYVKANFDRAVISRRLWTSITEMLEHR